MVFGKTSDVLTGTKVLEKVESPINGKMQVVKSIGLGTYIQVNNLTQSGGVVYDIWRTTLKKLKNSRTRELKNCLILGLGGGSAAKVVRKHWSNAEITGVEIDPIMVNLGKKYLKLDETKTKVVIGGAYKILTTKHHLPTSKFDLILVDVYIGDKVPEKFESDKFLKLILKLLTFNGVAIFNRLYYEDKRKQAEIFHKKLIHVFKKVRPFYPEANVMYICSKK
jgi:spermidine synthase